MVFKKLTEYHYLFLFKRLRYHNFKKKVFVYKNKYIYHSKQILEI